MATIITYHYHPPKPTNSLLVEKITKKRKEAKWDKTKIGVGNFVTVKAEDIDENIREGITRITRKELVACFQEHDFQLL